MTLRGERQTIHNWLSAEDRFTLQVAPCPITGCWLWTGVIVGGRGKLSVNKKVTMAYRYAWERENGPVPENMVLDHFRCNNPLCCNPDHVRPVSYQENALRGETIVAKNASKSVCPKCGCQYDRVTKEGGRYCRGCRTNRQRSARLSKKANKQHTD